MDPIMPEFQYATLGFQIGTQVVHVSISPQSVPPAPILAQGSVGPADAPDGMVSPGSDPLPTPPPAAPHLGDGHLLLAASQLTAQVLALILQFKSLFAVPLLVQPPATK